MGERLAPRVPNQIRLLAKIHRQRDKWWLYFAGANIGKTPTSMSRSDSKVLKILLGSCKENVGQRSVGSKGQVHHCLGVASGPSLLLGGGGRFSSHPRMLCPPGLSSELRDKLEIRTSSIEQIQTEVTVEMVQVLFPGHSSLPLCLMISLV